MVQTEMLDEVYREPFIPLRLHLTNGESFDIRNPGLVWVTKHSVFIAHPIRPERPGSRGIEDYDLISLVHVMRVEKIEAANGRPKRKRRPTG